jgi:hypothetical protein
MFFSLAGPPFSMKFLKCSPSERNMTNSFEKKAIFPLKTDFFLGKKMSFPCQKTWFDLSHWGWGLFFPRRKYLHTHSIKETEGETGVYVKACDGNSYILITNPGPCVREGELFPVLDEKNFFY